MHGGLEPQSGLRAGSELHQSETTDISKSGVPLAKGLSQFCSSVQPGKPLSKVTYFFLWDQAIRTPVKMDLPCSLLSPHGKRQVPTVSLRKASSLGETEGCKEAAWDTCTLYVCSFCPVLHPDFFCFLLPLHAFLTLKLHHWSYHWFSGPERNPWGTHQQGFLISWREHGRIFPRSF